MSPALLRDDLLAARRFVTAGGTPPALLAALGADVVPLHAALADEDALSAEADELPPADGLWVDGAAIFRAAGAGAAAAQQALDRTWNAVRAVALAAWIGPGRPGVVVLRAPRPEDGEGAEGTRAGLENMARTLSIEWARHGVRPVALAPGPGTSEDDVAALGAFLLSAGGGYFAGTALATA